MSRSASVAWQRLAQGFGTAKAKISSPVDEAEGMPLKVVKRQAGSAFVAVLMVLVLLAVLGASISTLGITEARKTRLQQQGVQAYYAARSGADVLANRIESTINALMDDYMTVDDPNGEPGGGEGEGGEEDEAPDSVDAFISAWNDAAGLFPGLRYEHNYGLGRFAVEVSEWLTPDLVYEPDPEDEETWLVEYLFSFSVEAIGADSERGTFDASSKVSLSLTWTLEYQYDPDDPDGEPLRSMRGPDRQWRGGS